MFGFQKQLCVFGLFPEAKICIERCVSSFQKRCLQILQVNGFAKLNTFVHLIWATNRIFARATFPFTFLLFEQYLMFSLGWSAMFCAGVLHVGQFAVVKVMSNEEIPPGCAIAFSNMFALMFVAPYFYIKGRNHIHGICGISSFLKCLKLQIILQLMMLKHSFPLGSFLAWYRIFNSNWNKISKDDLLWMKML